MENVYRLRWKKGIREQLRMLPGRIREEITKTILGLRDEPYPPDAEELRDQYRGILKIKLDGWRVLYEVNENDKTVTVIAVKRRDVNTYLNLFSVLF